MTFAEKIVYYFILFSGQIISNEHHIPGGGWFRYVSSPHYLAEIIIYFSILIILWNNTTWKYVFVWVLSNQVGR